MQLYLGTVDEEKLQLFVLKRKNNQDYDEETQNHMTAIAKYVLYHWLHTKKKVNLKFKDANAVANCNY